MKNLILQFVSYFLFFVFLVSCESKKEINKVQLPKAENGILDLTNYDWKNGLVNLDGQWEFYWEEFLSPNESSTLLEKTFIPVPSQWQKQKIIRNGEEIPLPRYGFASYKLHVILPKQQEELKESYLSSGELSLLVPTISSSYSIYINGELILQSGKVGKSRDESEQFHRRKEIALNLKNKKELDILVHVSNFYDISVSGIWDSFQLGYSKDTRDVVFKKSWLTFILCSALLIMGLYHIVLYVNRRKDISTIYFGFFCILMSFREVSIGYRHIIDIIPEIPFWLVHKLEFIPFYGGGILFLFFIRSLFPLEFSQKIFQFLIVISFPAFVILVFTPIYIYSYTRTYYQLASLISLSYCVKVMVSGAIHKRMGAKLFLSATVIFFITVINDILRAMGVVFTPPLATIGLLSFVFFQAVILSRRLMNAFVESERLTEELRKSTEYMKQKIEEGIKEQQKYHQVLLNLNKSDTFNRFGFDLALQEITKVCSEILEVDRVAVWKINESLGELICLNLYKTKEKEFESGLSFKVEDYPIYFSYFAEGKNLLAPNVNEHPFEVEFNEVYHKPLGIESIIEIPIHSSGKILGVVVCESIGNRRDWTSEEESFVSSIASIVVGLFEAKAKQDAFLQLEKTKAEIEGLNELTQNINSVSSLIDIMSFIMYYLETDFGYKEFWLVLIEKDKEEFYTFSFVSNQLSQDSISYFKDWRRKIGPEVGSIYNAYNNREFVFQKFEDNKDLTEEDEKIKSITNWEYFLHFPLLIYGETIGILSIQKPVSPKNILLEEISKLEKFTNQISGSIFNAGLLKETEEARSKADLEKGIALLAKQEAEQERHKSEKLLLNILPEDVALELKEKGSTEPVLFESVSVLFTDFKGFTQIAETLSPSELVKELDSCFIQFDKIMERYKLEKLKTIGDSYMCAGGIPKKNNTHAIDAVLAALEIQNFMNQMKEIKEIIGIPYWELRLGIHTGSLVAGVIGEKKFAYDVWGDTVNTASRMESSGTPGQINISGATYNIIKDLFNCEYRGKMNAKNKGEVDMYYVHSIKQDLVTKDNIPNQIFWEKYEKIKTIK